MTRLTYSAVSLALAAAIAPCARAAETLTGVYALPEGQPKVTATLTATPGRNGAQTMDVAMTPIGQAKPVLRYETELSKQLHLIAIGADFRSFVHEHGNRPGPDGHFRIAMRLPQPGAYHIYADGVPAGLGQQVVRFELNTGGPAPAAVPAPAPSGFEGADGRYAARFDSFELHAGQESQLTLHLARDGKPARDVIPFLGVAAHAVFIDAADLTYVHVHAAPAANPASGGTGAAMHHDHTAMAGMPGMDMPAPLPAGSHVPPDLTLHVQAPKAGIYLLWLQFQAGGQVRTAPFVVAVR